MTSEFICEQCNKCYKSLKTLNNHNIKCNTEQKCKYCSEEFSSLSTINRHYKICKDYKYILKIETIIKEKEQEKIKYEIKLAESKIKYDNEIETIIKEKEKEKLKDEIKLAESKNKYDTEIDNIRTEKEKEKLKYEIKLTESKMEYDNLFKTSQINYSEYETFISKHKKEYKDLDNSSSKIINELKYKIKDHEKEAKIDKVNLYKFTNEIIKLRNNTTNITNNNNNINIQNILKFDPSSISVKMTDDKFIKNEDQMVNHIIKHGITNCFRVTDKKRNTLTWKDGNGTDIKDPNGISFANTISDAIKPDMIIQKEIAEQKIAHMNTKKEQDINYTKMNEYKEVTEFSNNIISKHKNTMLNLGKKIAKAGSGINDKSNSYVSSNIYSNFMTELSNVLIKNFDKWIIYDIYNLGQFLKREMNLKIIKEANDYPLYIIIKDNDEVECNIFGKEFEKIIKQSMTDTLSNIYMTLTLKILSNIDKYNEENVSKMIEWLKSDAEISNEENYTMLMSGMWYGYGEFAPYAK